jgi:ribosomal protein L29
MLVNRTSLLDDIAQLESKRDALKAALANLRVTAESVGGA